MENSFEDEHGIGAPKKKKMPNKRKKRINGDIV